MLLTVTLTLLEGLGTTLKLFALTLLFALPLGLVIALGAMSRITPLRWLVSMVVWVVRGTPLMIQILIIFYGPGLLFDLPLLPRFGAALLSFVINYACYFSEIYRGGIQSIPKGQYEAGEVLGMTRSQIFFKVTLLQVMNSLPMGGTIRLITCSSVTLKKIWLLVMPSTSPASYWPLGMDWMPPR